MVMVSGRLISLFRTTGPGWLGRRTQPVAHIDLDDVPPVGGTGQRRGGEKPAQAAWFKPELDTKVGQHAQRGVYGTGRTRPGRWDHQ